MQLQVFYLGAGFAQGGENGLHLRMFVYAQDEATVGVVVVGKRRR